MIIFLIILGIVGGILAGIVYTAFGNSGISGTKTTVLILNTVYAMLFLVVLLSYGLFFMPAALWKSGDNK